jgi:hypothetical protein
MWPLLSENPSGAEFAFWICAIGGTFFFLLRIAFFIIGGMGSEDMDGHDGHDGHDAHDHADSHSDFAFKLVSINSLSSFVMMFGWSGLTAIKEYGLTDGVAIFIALLVGFVTMTITAYMFVWAMKFVSTGADFQIDQLIGKTAKVYQRIPAKGLGKIQISVNDLMREIDAESTSGVDIDSFTPVQVDKVIGTDRVSVSIISDN